MSMIFIYSFAFMFVKIYAEKSILTDSELPKEYVDSADTETKEEKQPAVTESTEAPEPEITHSAVQPVEYIVNKQQADEFPMLAAQATNIPDEVKLATEPDTEETTAPESSEPPITETKKTEKSEKTEKSSETEPPQTSETQQPAEKIDDEEVPDEAEDPVIEEAYEDEQSYINETPDEAQEIKELTEEEFRELLKDLGITDFGQPQPAPSNPEDQLYSTDSYHNQTVTIYDTKQKRYRTENAYDLVCEITSYEVGASMNPETIKAQAVAVYTYIKYYEQKGECAEIGTKSDVPQIIKDCVEAVDGLAMYYDGKYIMSAFSASTGGYSAASKNVWGGDLPYLQSVKNDYDYLDSKNYGMVTIYTVEEVREKIESKTDIKLSDNYSEWIRILSYNDNIYAGQLSIDGHTTAKIAGKERTITGHIFRTYVLNIRSTAFNISYADGVFTVTTYGYGHGVGMSQVGANLYATYGGYTFDQILHHYYTGVTIR